MASPSIATTVTSGDESFSTKGEEEAASTKTIAPALPLRPSLRERLTHCTNNLLPQPYYFHPLLTRRRFLILIAGVTAILLLLIILLPALLVPRLRSQRALSLPLEGDLHAGEGTYYDPGLGACGIESDESQMIVAIAWRVFDAMGGGVTNPNLNPVCGRKIRARRLGGGGEAVEVTVVDRCTGCEDLDLDFSLAAFEKVADEWEGRVGIEWTWV